MHRIRATRDLPRHGVDKGMLGGWVEHSTCLAGDAWVDDDARVFRNAKVYGQALVGEDALIADQAKVYGDGCGGGGRPRLWTRRKCWAKWN